MSTTAQYDFAGHTATFRLPEGVEAPSYCSERFYADCFRRAQ